MMKFQKLSQMIMLSVLLSLLSFGAVSAQQEEPFPSDDDVNEIARQLYCPVCENIPLDVCDTQACEQWRGLIREKLAAGWTDEQIKDYFVLQYGDRVLAEPPRRGLNWLVYILPPAFFLAGALIVFRVLKRMNKPEPVELHEPPENEQAPLDPYVSRIEEALKERRK